MLRNWVALVGLKGNDYDLTIKQFFTEGSMNRYMKRLDREGGRTGKAYVFHNYERIYSVLPPETLSRNNMIVMSEWHVKAHMKSGGIEELTFQDNGEVISYLRGSRDYRGDTHVFHKGDIDNNTFSEYI